MNTMDKITVQIFCNKDTAMRLVIDHQLMRVLFQSLQVFFFVCFLLLLLPPFFFIEVLQHFHTLNIFAVDRSVIDMLNALLTSS